MIRNFLDNKYFKSLVGTLVIGVIIVGIVYVGYGIVVDSLKENKS